VRKREVYREVTPKVEYSLTLLGERLAPLLDTMREWGISLSETRAEQTAFTSEA
jgi:DNA-binding HxlR family transcriptional regulator